MALSDVLKPKSKEEMAKNVYQYYLNNKKVYDEDWSVKHIIVENTLGDVFVNEVINAISKIGSDEDHSNILCVTEGDTLFPNLYSILLETPNASETKGTCGWNYLVYPTLQICLANSKDKNKAILFNKDTFINIVK